MTFTMFPVATILHLSFTNNFHVTSVGGATATRGDAEKVESSRPMTMMEKIRRRRQLNKDRAGGSEAPSQPWTMMEKIRRQRQLVGLVGSLRELPFVIWSCIGGRGGHFCCI